MVKYYLYTSSFYNFKRLEFINPKKDNFTLPIRIKKLTVLRSPFVNKSSREQFEFRIYKKLFIFKIENLNFNLSVFEFFFFYYLKSNNKSFFLKKKIISNSF